MIEGDGEKRWGGVFEGSITDGLTALSPSKQKPTLLQKFDQWDESVGNLVNSNPHIAKCPGHLYTTSVNVRNLISSCFFCLAESNS